MLLSGTHCYPMFHCQNVKKYPFFPHEENIALTNGYSLLNHGNQWMLFGSQPVKWFQYWLLSITVLYDHVITAFLRPRVLPTHLGDSYASLLMTVSQMRLLRLQLPNATVWHHQHPEPCSMLENSIWFISIQIPYSLGGSVTIPQDGDAQGKHHDFEAEANWHRSHLAWRLQCLI